MRYIHPLPWPEWERFALLDVVTVVGVVAVVGLAINRLRNADRPRGDTAQHRSPMTARPGPPRRFGSKRSVSEPKRPPPSLLWLAWRQLRVRLYFLGLMVAAVVLFALLHGLLQPLAIGGDR